MSQVQAWSSEGAPNCEISKSFSQVHISLVCLDARQITADGATEGLLLAHCVDRNCGIRVLPYHCLSHGTFAVDDAGFLAFIDCDIVAPVD
jgi:hypothetical protein